MKLLVFTTLPTTKTLTIHDAPKEQDAFEYTPFYDGWIEVFATKGKDVKETATSGNHRYIK